MSFVDGPYRTLAKTRRWRIGRYILEQALDRSLWILGRDDFASLEALPRPMTDRDVERLRYPETTTVAEMLEQVEECAEMARIVPRLPA